MKKLMVILTVLAVLFSHAAFAEETGMPAMQIPVSTYVQVNLGNEGWGAVEWNKTSIDEYTEGVSLGIATESGSKIGWTMWNHDYLFNASVWAADIDHDGNTEILVSGDIASNDYYTFCLRYENGEIRHLPFANTERGSDCQGYTDYGYGMVSGFGYNTITLTGSQDVLGTYFASRTFTLQNGVLEIADDGLWRFDVDPSDPEQWEYRSLKAVRPVPVTLFNIEDGKPYDATLQPGERVILTASDCKTIAYFLNENGYEGCFTLGPNPDSWGSLIGGIPENELFEYVPYAD